MARDIQQMFLPSEFSLAGPGAELFAKCLPARFPAAGVSLQTERLQG